jgi:glutamate-1-semialdehyde aminotransferase
MLVKFQTIKKIVEEVRQETTEPNNLERKVREAITKVTPKKDNNYYLKTAEQLAELKYLDKKPKKLSKEVTNNIKNAEKKYIAEMISACIYLAGTNRHREKEEKNT